MALESVRDKTIFIKCASAQNVAAEREKVQSV